MVRFMKGSLRWLAYAYAGYLAICLLVLLPLLNIMTPALLRDAINRELESELILFNPFSLALEVRRAGLLETDGHRPLSFKQLEVNLSLASLWEPGVVLDAFVLEELDIHVLRYADGSFHFADLLAGDAATEESPDDTALPAFTVRDIAITAQRIQYTDRTRPGPYVVALSDLELAKRNLTTVPDRRGDGDLELTGDGGGVLRWRGDTQIAEESSSGEVTLQDIDLRPAWRYSAEQLNFVLDSARLDARLNYSVTWGDTVELTLRDSSLELRDLALQPAADLSIDDTGVELRSLRLAGLELRLSEQTVSLTDVAVRGLAIEGYDEGEEVSLLRLFEMPESAAAATESPAADLTGESEAAAPWTLRVDSASVDDSRIAWRTPRLAPALIRVDPLRIGAQDILWPAEAATPLSLELAVNDAAMLNVDGNLHIGSGAGQANLQLQTLPLPWINPLVHEALRTDIESGALSLTTAITLDEFAPLEVGASLQIDEFATVLHETGQQAFQLQQLTVTEAQIDIAQQSVRIGELALQQPVGSLHILEDGRMNINGVVREFEGAQDDGEGSESAEAAAGTDESDASWRVALDKLTVRDGRLDFADDSLPLPFQTVVESIRADATDIDTAAEEALDLVFTGSVDGYAPVRIEGSGRPLARERDGLLQLDFRGMDIATMSPYSGTYAGYTIDSGTLSLNLRYALDGQKLDGDNRIVISQMELGEPVESELAIDVPLKLGLALLTDSQGVIDLSVPVSGNVDDPSFSLGPIIGRAIKNIIVKAVTAPFSLLAGLVGSEDDLENIDFAAGSRELSIAGSQALASLAEALQQRPQLKLRVAGGADPVADRAALKAARLRQSFLDAGLSEAAVENRDATFIAALDARYAALVADGGDSRQSDPEAPPPDTEAKWQRLLDEITLPATALQSLGTARAAAAKRELVTSGGIAAERIAIAFDSALNASGVRMAVES